MPTILGIDPGGTTGLALIEFEATTEPRMISVQHIPNGLAGFLDWQLKVERVWDFIVCENFTVRPGVHGVDITPAYIIGAIEALEGKHVKINYQTPSQKPLCDDAALKRLGVHSTGMGHANDAARHAIIYLRNVRHIPTLKKGWKDE